MDPASKSAQPPDIGTVVAIVGTKGWQCRLCSSIFPRSFSLDHHMITSHHPQASQGSGLPSAVSASVSGDQCSNMEEDNVQDVSVVGDSGKDKHQRVSSSESMEGVRCAPVCSETEHVFAAADDSRKDEGSLRIKVEPGVNSSENVNRQENLSVYFDEKSDQRNVRLAADKENTSSSKQSNMDRFDTRVGMNRSEKGSLNLAEGFFPHPLNQDNNPVDNCSQFRKDKTTNSAKPYKRRTCSCGQVFESKQEFRSHRRGVHCKLKHKSFICHICGSEYSYKRGLNRHLTDKGSQAVSCTSCPKQFHDHNSLQEHQKLCHGSEIHTCVSSGNERMDGDTNQTQNSAFNPSQKTSHPEVEDSFPWECSKCKKHFEDRVIFRKHLGECGILSLIGGKRHFTCNLCGRGFQCLVPYHRHYVQDHKLAFLGGSADSPAHFSPFMGNSPVPSPAPSVTSEINTAMAEVNLNQSNALNTREGSSPWSSTIDLTSDLDIHQEAQSRVNEDDVSLIPIPQTTVGSSSSSISSAVCTSGSPFTAVTCSSNVSSLNSVSDSSGLSSLTAATSSSEPPSLNSTASSSNPRSFPPDLSSCSASLSEQASEVESIIISDTEETHSSDSSSDSEEDWELITDEDEKEHVKKKMGPDTADYKAAHEGEEFCFRNFHHQRHHPPPPPPFPHPRHPCPPPPFFHESFIPFRRFPPPHHHRHHHPRFGRGGFMPWDFFGAARFGHPNCFGQEDHMPDNSQKSGNTTSTPGPNQEWKSSQHDQSTGYGPEHSNPLFHAEAFSEWAGKWKEEKRYKKMQKRIMISMMKSCHTGGQFLFCPDCPQSFTEESELDRHCRENHPTPGEYTCFICQQTLSQPLPYNRHIKEHCETWLRTGCHRGRGRGRGLFGMGHRFLKQLWKAGGPYNLVSQFFGHGHQPQDTDKDSSEPEVPAQENFKECPFCNKKYRANSRESFFERHVNSHFGVEVYSFKCEECGKKFLEKGKFTAHQAKHKAPLHICKICGNSYQSKTSLKRHERIHTGERPHKCPDCGEGFIELRELERHRMKHTGQDPFKCMVCGKGFTLKDTVLNHVRKQHPEQKPEVCIRRAVPLTEVEQQRKQKAGSSAEAQADGTSIKAEKGLEPQEELFMELD